jgi:Fic family protein
VARGIGRRFLPLVDVADRHFSYCEPPSLRSALRNLDVATRGALGGAASSNPPDDKTHLASSRAEEPFSSSLIEGAATTRQVAKQMIFERRRPKTIDERMVFNNYHAMEFVKGQARRAPHARHATGLARRGDGRHA